MGYRSVDEFRHALAHMNPRMVLPDGTVIEDISREDMMEMMKAQSIAPAKKQRGRRTKKRRSRSKGTGKRTVRKREASEPISVRQAALLAASMGGMGAYAPGALEELNAAKEAGRRADISNVRVLTMMGFNFNVASGILDTLSEAGVLGYNKKGSAAAQTAQQIVGSFLRPELAEQIGKNNPRGRSPGVVYSWSYNLMFKGKRKGWVSTDPDDDDLHGEGLAASEQDAARAILRAIQQRLPGSKPRLALAERFSAEDFEDPNLLGSVMLEVWDENGVIEGAASVDTLAGLSGAAVANPRYDIPLSFPAADYQYGPRPRVAQWTSYPQYSYDQFYRPNTPRTPDPAAATRGAQAGTGTSIAVCNGAGCPTCGAHPGEKCTTARGNPTRPHAARKRRASRNPKVKVYSGRVWTGPGRSYWSVSLRPHSRYAQIEQEFVSEVDVPAEYADLIAGMKTAGDERQLLAWLREEGLISEHRGMEFGARRNPTPVPIPPSAAGAKPVDWKMAQNAGPFLPEMYPYGVRGKPVTYSGIALDNGAISEFDRHAAFRAGGTLDTQTGAWPVKVPHWSAAKNRQQAIIALQFMARGFGNRAKYATYIRKLAALYPPSVKANKPIWSFYQQHRDGIKQMSRGRMPTLKTLKKVKRQRLKAAANPRSRRHLRPAPRQMEWVHEDE